MLTHGRVSSDKQRQITIVCSTDQGKDAFRLVEPQTTGSRNRSASSSAPLGQRTFRELFLCADRSDASWVAAWRPCSKKPPQHWSEVFDSF